MVIVGTNLVKNPFILTIRVVYLQIGAYFKKTRTLCHILSALANNSHKQTKKLAERAIEKVDFILQSFIKLTETAF